MTLTDAMLRSAFSRLQSEGAHYEPYHLILPWMAPLQSGAIAKRSGIVVLWPDGHPYYGRRRVTPDGRII